MMTSCQVISAPGQLRNSINNVAELDGLVVGREIVDLCIVSASQRLCSAAIKALLLLCTSRNGFAPTSGNVHALVELVAKLEIGRRGSACHARKALGTPVDVLLQKLLYDGTKQ